MRHHENSNQQIRNKQSRHNLKCRFFRGCKEKLYAPYRLIKDKGTAKRHQAKQHPHKHKRKALMSNHLFDIRIIMIFSDMRHICLPASSPYRTHNCLFKIPSPKIGYAPHAIYVKALSIRAHASSGNFAPSTRTTSLPKSAPICPHVASGWSCKYPYKNPAAQ